VEAHADRDRAVRAETDAQAQTTAAKDAWATSRRNGYAAEINVAFQALAENNLGRARDLLGRQRPKAGQEDLRGFEWRYLWQLCQGDELETFHDDRASGAAFSPRWKMVRLYLGGRPASPPPLTRGGERRVPTMRLYVSYAPRRHQFGRLQR